MIERNRQDLWIGCVGVELVDGAVDGVAVGEVDASIGVGSRDLFGGAPAGLVVESVAEDGRPVPCGRRRGPDNHQQAQLLLIEPHLQVNLVVSAG